MLTNAQWAEYAITYVQSQLGKFPSNHYTRLLRRGGQPDVCVIDVRERLGPRDKNRREIMDIRRRASLAKTAKCGRCGEYAAVCFDYLLHSSCYDSIELANYTDPGDHAFVIIGRTKNSDVTKPKSWGITSIIADAWLGKVIRPSRYWQDMPRFPLTLQSVQAPRVMARLEALALGK